MFKIFFKCKACGKRIFKTRGHPLCDKCDDKYLQLIVERVMKDV